jgi:hypothetical protein
MDEPRTPIDRVDSEVERLDPFWGPQLVVAAALALDVFLPQKVTLGPRWTVPSIEGALLLVLVASTPHPRMRYSELRRSFATLLIGLVSAANFFSLVELVHFLLQGGKAGGRALIGAGALLWVTNVLLFGLWYWQIDRGGPVARATHQDSKPDFMFVQNANPELAPTGWEPGLLDYMYVSLTNATAFSPTDTMPLTQMAKMLMGAQAVASLVIVGLVFARAVNILT